VTWLCSDFPWFSQAFQYISMLHSISFIPEKS
jgi:hypothetical protein